MTTLAYERDLLTFIRNVSLRMALDRLVALAKKTERDGGRAADDAVLRQRLVALLIEEKCLQLNGYRSLTRLLRGEAPGPEGSTSKLSWSQVDQELAELATEILGLRSQITEGAWAVDEGQWAYNCLLARASTIRAGTSEILKNILGERVLGLPKD
jgi:alkylation response protein AidB-like acyl-CoA dehydrogenase